MRVISTILALALALAPLSVAAQEPDNLATVERLYDEGLNLYETADYDGAIAKWTEAYSLVGDGPESTEIRSTLIYNLASAHEAAFDIDADTTHLTKAKVLLERFELTIPDVYEGENAEAERVRVRERIAVLDAKLAKVRGETPEPEPGDTSPEPVVEPTGEPEPQPDPQPDTGKDKPRANKPLLIAGSVALVVGLGGVGAGVAGLIEADRANEFDDEALGITPESLSLRHDQIRHGQQMNALTYAGFIAGGVLVVAGATLIGLSVRADKQRVAAVPSVGPRHAGLILRGSF